MGQIYQNLHAKWANPNGFSRLSSFSENRRIGTLPLDQDPMAHVQRHRWRPNLGGATAPAARWWMGGSPRGLGWTWGWCRSTAEARGRCWGGLVRRRRAAPPPRTRDVDGELLAASLCKQRRERQRTVAVEHDKDLGEEKREREGQHGHNLVVDHLGQRRGSRMMQVSSSPAAAIPPSWRCTREGGVVGKGQWATGWRGVEEFVLGAACFIAELRRTVDLVLGLSSGHTGSP